MSPDKNENNIEIKVHDAVHTIDSNNVVLKKIKVDINKEDQQFSRDWIVDFSTLTVKRKSFGFFRNVKEKLWKTKYPVHSLYRFARRQDDKPDTMSYPRIINSDDLPKIEGITRYELNDDWKIPKSDLKTLIFGPLTKGKNVLVPPSPKNRLLITFWEGIKIFSTIGGAITFLIIIYRFISSL